MAQDQSYLQAVAFRLKQVQKHFNLSDRKLADHMGVNHNTYYRNRKALHLPSLRALMNLDKNLGVSMEWVLFERENMLWKDNIEKKEKTSLRVLNPTQGTGEDSMSEEVKELEYLMRKIPLFRYSVMSFYHQFIKDNPGISD